jgi:hypothetical protein
MEKKFSALLLLLVVSLGAAGLFGYMAVSAVPNPPSEVKTIVSNLSITDVTKDSALTVTCVSAGTLSYGAPQSVLPSQSFTLGQSYPQTVWLWQRAGDTQFVMKVWGPDQNGGYDLEFGRCCTDQFTVMYKGTTIQSVPQIASMTNGVAQSGYFIAYEMP